MYSEYYYNTANRMFQNNSFDTIMYKNVKYSGAQQSVEPLPDKKVAK